MLVNILKNYWILFLFNKEIKKKKKRNKAREIS